MTGKPPGIRLAACRRHQCFSSVIPSALLKGGGSGVLVLGSQRTQASVFFTKLQDDSAAAKTGEPCCKGKPNPSPLCHWGSSPSACLLFTSWFPELSNDFSELPPHPSIEERGV